MTAEQRNFYLVIEKDAARAAAGAGALANHGLACVLIRPVAANVLPREALGHAVSAFQQAGIAVLFESVEEARAYGADGIHVDLNGSEDTAPIKDAITKLKPSGIVGAGGLHSRHAAMSAAELDVDYVMFGEPAEDGQPPALPAVLERAKWWSETCTVPCVVYATDSLELSEIAATGCDFISLSDIHGKCWAALEIACKDSVKAKETIT